MGNRRPEDELPTVDVDDPSSPFHISAYRVEKTAAGWALETDGTADDHGRALDALHVLMGGSAPEAVQRPTPPALEAPVEAPRPTPRVLRTVPGIALGEAARKYLPTLEGVMMPDKTRTQKRASVNGFTKWKGLKKSLLDCSRTDNVGDKSAEMLLGVDRHAPASTRVNGPTSNMSQFSRAFACKTSDALNRPDKDRVVIW